MSETWEKSPYGMDRREFLRKTARTALSISFISLVRIVPGASAEEIHRPLIPEDMTPGEKMHVPRIDMPKVADQVNVPVMIGMDHPMTKDHYIEWIEIRDPKAIFKKKTRFYYTPANGQAYLYTIIKVPQTTTIKVRAKCSREGVWEAEMDIKVPAGGKYSC